MVMYVVLLTHSSIHSFVAHISLSSPSWLTLHGSLSAFLVCVCIYKKYLVLPVFHSSPTPPTPPSCSRQSSDSDSYDFAGPKAKTRILPQERHAYTNKLDKSFFALPVLSSAIQSDSTALVSVPLSIRARCGQLQIADVSLSHTPHTTLSTDTKSFAICRRTFLPLFASIHFNSTLHSTRLHLPTPIVLCIRH